MPQTSSGQPFTFKKPLVEIDQRVLQTAPSNLACTVPYRPCRQSHKGWEAVGRSLTLAKAYIRFVCAVVHVCELVNFITFYGCICCGAIGISAVLQTVELEKPVSPTGVCSLLAAALLRLTCSGRGPLCF